MLLIRGYQKAISEEVRKKEWMEMTKLFSPCFLFVVSFKLMFFVEQWSLVRPHITHAAEFDSKAYSSGSPTDNNVLLRLKQVRVNQPNFGANFSREIGWDFFSGFLWYGGFQFTVVNTDIERDAVFESILHCGRYLIVAIVEHRRRTFQHIVLGVVPGK